MTDARSLERPGVQVGILSELIKGVANVVSGGDAEGLRSIPYGKQKKDGDRDHRRNRGGDRTPSQKKGDRKRRKT